MWISFNEHTHLVPTADREQTLRARQRLAEVKESSSGTSCQSHFGAYPPCPHLPAVTWPAGELTTWRPRAGHSWKRGACPREPTQPPPIHLLRQEHQRPLDMSFYLNSSHCTQKTHTPLAGIQGLKLCDLHRPFLPTYPILIFTLTCSCCITVAPISCT